MNYDYEINLHVNDKLKIGNDVTITICRLGSLNTHFGCEAPRHISIVRKEIIEKKEIVLEEIILK